MVKFPVRAFIFGGLVALGVIACKPGATEENGKVGEGEYSDTYDANGDVSFGLADPSTTKCGKLQQTDGAE